MEEEMDRPMIVTDSSHSLSIFQVLFQVPKILYKNGKFMVLNKLFVLLSFCILVLATDLVLTPVIVDIISKISQLHDLVDPNREIIEGIIKNFQLLLGLELLFSIAFFFVPLFSLVATIYISCAKTQLNLKGWFAKVDRSWKRPMINWFYITLVSTVIVMLVLILLSVLSVTVMDTALIILILMVAISLGYIFFVSVWILSLVMSIIEENLDGIGTVARTEDHIRGRRLQGFGISLISSVVSIAIFTGCSFTTNEINRGTGTGFVTGFAVLAYVCMVKLFMFFVYTVYYYECKIRNAGQQIEVEERLISPNEV